MLLNGCILTEWPFRTCDNLEFIKILQINAILTNLGLIAYTLLIRKLKITSTRLF